ncbi:hypothetical protein ACLB2K_038373 [Fragaria x ananassa]
MEGTLGLLGGGSSGCSTNESAMSKVDHQVVEHMSSEVSSCPAEAELELGLGLSLGSGSGGGSAQKSKGCAWGERGRILTAKDFPSMVSHGSARFSQRANNASSVSGNKRAAEEGGYPTAVSQVVGWPPISASRMNSLVNQAKAARSEDDKTDGDKSKDTFKKKINTGNNKSTVKEKGHLGFVKVNMDGIPIGRKVDLNAHTCYETLAQTLEEMFFSTTSNVNSIAGVKEQATKPSRLLDGSSEFVLTYEDKEGDWMLVGDVPWRMFLTSVKRLRIMRTSEANGLAPRFQERGERLRNKPI